jgi:hypothetical protein
MNLHTAPLDERIFIALQAYEQTKYAALDQTSNQRLSFTDIVSCVRCPDLPRSIRTLTIVNQRLDYRRKYRFILLQMSTLQSPQQVAASSNERLLQRNEAQFSIQIIENDKPIRGLKEDASVKIVLTLSESTEHNMRERAYLHCETDSKIEVVECQAGGGDRFSAVLSHDDLRMVALSDVNSHMYVTFT